MKPFDNTFNFSRACFCRTWSWIMSISSNLQYLLVDSSTVDTQVTGTPRMCLIIRFECKNRSRCFLLPNINLMAPLASVFLFSSLKLVWWYWQVTMDETTLIKRLTIVPCFLDILRVPIGLSYAPITFQHLLNDIWLLEFRMDLVWLIWWSFYFLRNCAWSYLYIRARVWKSSSNKRSVRLPAISLNQKSMVWLYRWWSMISADSDDTNTILGHSSSSLNSDSNDSSLIC